MSETFLAGAAQVAPAYLDLEKSLDIAEDWIARAGKQPGSGSSFVLIPYVSTLMNLYLVGA